MRVKKDWFASFTTEFFKISWQDGGLGESLFEGDQRVLDQVWAVMEYQAPKVETHMKVNAPWTDQTGNARQGLRAEAFREDDNMGIVLYHTVPYGIWLEVLHSGAYAIIGPTIEVMGPQVMQSVEHIMEEI